MKQWILYAFLVVLVLFFVQADVVTAAENDEETITDELVQSQIERIGIEDITKFWDDIVTEYGGFLPESQKGSFMDFVTGDKQFSFSEWFKGLGKFVFHELLVNGKLLGSLILLTIFSMFLQSLQNAFEQSSISKVAYSIVYMVLIILALNSFHVAIQYTTETIDKMIAFLMAMIPLLLALVASSGGIISAAFFHPVLIFLMNTSGILIQYVVLPMLFLSAILNIVSTLTEQYKVTQLAQMLRNWAIGILGAFMTIFLGVISVQGSTSAVADGITIRTAKFVTGNFIPVIGRMFTDATDTVISASVLLKNMVGMAGVAVLLLIVVFPALKILTLSLIYKLSASLLQPLGGGPVIKCLDIISKSMIYIFAALAIVSLMFFLSVTIIIAAGNITLMVR
ncbi:stage III sporulation protein AE [Peribacillus psychrosaccharolyticus]|uniref:Stage III sporulation protein AE n=1 Tax=Peribacillus psychrosaccharolyticus TaxID=1407 RepID=A0A974NLA7_PERPY|nr:stage III sporulation protein AE [Peribacillus psychrosaccharolyticus]MEC2056877.1 stage III sporulation protein AE [Peribacillus psychrosaccharolyticus]MED3746459.1 stage III sporulation protein AE [Peribacillus psychrosaccharolyticus]QQT00002.1 stage III sporulation protein AE [Peribacillus psychrosaccharolyticus]